jgi:hypothetical protein
MEFAVFKRGCDSSRVFSELGPNYGKHAFAAFRSPLYYKPWNVNTLAPPHHVLLSFINQFLILLEIVVKLFPNTF